MSPFEELRDVMLAGWPGNSDPPVPVMEVESALEAPRSLISPPRTNSACVPLAVML